MSKGNNDNLKSRIIKEKEFIVAEVKKHLSASIKSGKYEVIDAVQKMPTFEGFILPYYVSAMEGTQYPVNVEEMYIYRDGWEGFYNETIVKAAQAILEAEQIKEA